MVLSRTQLIVLFIITVGVANRSMALPILLEDAERDSWISVLASYGVMLIWVYILYVIMARNKQKARLFDWMEAKGGRLIKAILCSLFALSIILSTAITFFGLVRFVDIFFLPRTSAWVISLALLLISAWAAHSGIRTIAYVTAFFLPIALFLFLFVSIFTFPEMDASYLFPIFSDGPYQALKGVFPALSGFDAVIYLLLIHHYGNKPFTYLNLLLLVTSAAVLLFTPAIADIAIFGPSVASSMRYPTFEQWRILTMGEHLTHLDFFGVLQLLVGATARISLGLFLLLDMPGKAGKVKKWLVLLGSSAALMVAGILPVSDMVMSQLVKTYISPALLIIAFILTFVIWVISILPDKNGLHLT